MKISVIGAGRIGGTLGAKWAAAGHDVVFGVREPQAEKIQNLVDQIGQGTAATSLSEAIAGAEVVVFAIPGRVMRETVARLGGHLNGKILVDATNNVGLGAMHSLDVLREAAPDSPLYRAFSTLGWENFAEPVIDGVQVDLFYCGDEGEAQETMQGVIGDVGLRPVYIGGIDQVDLIDALTRLWFRLALQQGRGRHLALKMIGGGN